MAGGFDNIAGGYSAAVGGGQANKASSSWATVAGGGTNTASGNNATVGGGGSNNASIDFATVGGGAFNTASGFHATVGGGNNNIGSGSSATVSGGDSNMTSSSYATIGGGHGNVGSATNATVSGGKSNTAGGSNATVGGGQGNSASGPWATVGGGINNTASGGTATVGGGNNNAASSNATVGGGANNNASGDTATIGGGGSNSASGQWATVPGGEYNKATGTASFAGGDMANAVTNGTFVWADNSDIPLTSTVANQFLVRASGGVTLYTDSGATVGASLYPGSGSWNNLSDRNLKANFRSVDPLSILNQVASVPVQTWNYTTQNESIRHIGPMAQDFHAAFNVGENNTTISTVDALGVAFAAIQGLYQVAQSKDAQIVEQQTQISRLQSQMDDQAQELRQLKEPVAGKASLPNSNSQNILWFIAGGMMSLMAFGLGRRGKAGGR